LKEINVYKRLVFTLF